MGHLWGLFPGRGGPALHQVFPAVEVPGGDPGEPLKESDSESHGAPGVFPGPQSPNGVCAPQCVQLCPSRFLPSPGSSLSLHTRHELKEGRQPPGLHSTYPGDSGKDWKPRALGKTAVPAEVPNQESTGPPFSLKNFFFFI